MHMTHKRQWQVFSEEVFGGYGRFNAELLDFIAAKGQEITAALEKLRI